MKHQRHTERNMKIKLNLEKNLVVNKYLKESEITAMLP